MTDNIERCSPGRHRREPTRASPTARRARSSDGAKDSKGTAQIRYVAISNVIFEE